MYVWIKNSKKCPLWPLKWKKGRKVHIKPTNEGSFLCSHILIPQKVVVLCSAARKTYWLRKKMTSFEILPAHSFLHLNTNVWKNNVRVVHFGLQQCIIIPHFLLLAIDQSITEPSGCTYTTHHLQKMDRNSTNVDKFGVWDKPTDLLNHYTAISPF